MESTDPEWWAFSRGQTRHYLIDVHSVVKTGDELTVMIARVPKDTPAGDYSHTIDQFGIQCRTRQSHVVMSSEALEDGVPEELFATDEPWEAIARDSFDDAIREIACDDMRPRPAILHDGEGLYRRGPAVAGAAGAAVRRRRRRPGRFPG